MTTRTEKRTHFIQRIGWGDANAVVVAGDASNRHYERLTKPNGTTAILMNAPPEKGEDVRPFVKILNILRTFGLEAPELLYADENEGFLLLEDLRDDLFARVCEQEPRQEKELYRAAVDVLAALCQMPAPETVHPYTIADFLIETDRVTDWYLPGVTGNPVSSDFENAFRAHITEAFYKIETTLPTLVLHDYHAENLLWLPERTGLKKVGLLDFQDAFIGHPAYDLVSLLEDARRDTSPELQAAMKSHFLSTTRLEPEAFNYAYAAIGAQRNLKIIGIFARLCIRDGKPRYVDLIPRVWAHLQNDLAHPDLRSLKEWVYRYIPTPTPEVLTRIKEAPHAAQ